MDTYTLHRVLLRWGLGSVEGGKLARSLLVRFGGDGNHKAVRDMQNLLSRPRGTISKAKRLDCQGIDTRSSSHTSPISIVCGKPGPQGIPPPDRASIFKAGRTNIQTMEYSRHRHRMSKAEQGNLGHVDHGGEW